VQHAASIAAIEEAFQNGANQKALELWTKLPEPVQGHSALILARLRAARASSEQDLAAAITAARARRPGDPSTELAAYDAFELARNHDEARHCLDAIEAAVGGDPYIDWLRAQQLYAAGDLSAASAACRKALEREPSLEEAWWTLAAISLETRAYDETLAALAKLNASFEIDWKDLETTPAYAEFFKSPQGARFRAQLKAKR
jgi:predicted Zn-dependent protease